MSRIIALHGLAGTSAEWDDLVRELALRSDVPVEPFDQLAHGTASADDGDLSREAHVAAVVTRIESGSAPVTLLGQSAGAHTAMLVAARHPELVDALILVEGGIGGDGPEATDDVIAWVRTLTDDDGRPRFDADALRRVLEPIHERPFWDDWEAVRCPTLIVRAQNSFIDEAEHERMAQSPHADLVHMADSGHDIHLDQPAALASAIAAFLDKITEKDT